MRPYVRGRNARRGKDGYTRVSLAASALTAEDNPLGLLLQNLPILPWILENPGPLTSSGSHWDRSDFVLG